MHKVFKDYNNTIESMEWRHKGYSVTLNPAPVGYQLIGDKVKSTKYLVFDKADKHISDAFDLNDAKEIIEEAIKA